LRTLFDGMACRTRTQPRRCIELQSPAGLIEMAGVIRDCDWIEG